MFSGMAFLIEALKISYNQYFLRYNQFGVPDFAPHFHHEGKQICPLQKVTLAKKGFPKLIKTITLFTILILQRDILQQTNYTKNFRDFD